MNHTARILGLAAALGAAALARPAAALNGASLTQRSNGAAAGTNWTLNDNGFVGTYVTLPSAGPVTFTVQAAGTASGGVNPHMDVTVDDYSTGFDVTPGTNPYQTTFNLPAGTHFVRTQFSNDPAKTARALTVNSFDVTGATIANSNTDANALAAADTYVANFRRGPGHLQLVGVPQGANVRVELTRHDFRFGTAVGGTSASGVNALLNNANYSNFLLNHFNAITPGNAGKWDSNEATRDVVTMAGVDALLNYAQAHNLGVRMHNMLWADNQQPAWATTLLTNANGGNATAKADLRGEISERIDYYVGNNDANPSDDRARKYVELDLLNEHVHKPNYWNVYGAAGVADIFTETAAAVAGAGSNATLFLNEYNVLQYGADSYGNWYREDVEEVAAAGGAISGVGVQYYPIKTASAGDSNAHSPARIQQIFQGLSVTGLPIALTEFGVQVNNSPTAAQAATYLTDTMRMTFGSPQASTFVTWGFWANDMWSQAPLAALVDTNFNLTAAGIAYEQLMNQWDVDQTLSAQADGSIDFTGYYGDYRVTVDGKSYALKLVKGTGQYSLVVNLSADFNQDGIVNAADLTTWQTAFDAETANGDANGDGVTDGGDYLLWQQQLGQSETAPLAVAAAAAIPEPSAALLLLAAVASAALAGRRAIR